MMGAAVGGQERLFYEFCLDERVPDDHLLRRIDAALDLSWLRAELAPYYSQTGCPSVDPELMIRMLLVGYCYSIRSERRLCQEVEMNLAYRWFCRLGLEDRVPNHSTFSVNRHGRFRDSDILRTVFEQVVCTCMGAGLVGSAIKYMAKRSDCAACPLKPQCTTGRERRLSRDVNQDARDYTQTLMQTEPYKVSRTERKKIERLFGEAKTSLSLTRLRLRGLAGARDEFLLAAIVQNLKRLAAIAAIPPPTTATT